MQINRKNQQNGEVELSVTLDREECNTCQKQALKQIAHNFAQKGFRAGKVPETIIQNTAKDRLFLSYEQHALEMAVGGSLEKEKIKAVTSPEVKIIKSVPEETFECVISIIPYPEIKIGAYKDLKIKKKPIEIDEKKIDKALEFLRQSRAQFKDTIRAAEKDHQLDIGFEAFHNHQKNETGSAAHYPLRLGKSHLHPKFEAQLYGMKPQDEKTFSIDFPKDWPQADFKDKKIEFKVKLNAVQEVILPPLNDEFAKSLGNFGDLSSLKISLREGLAQEKNQEEENRLKEEIFEKIIKNSKIQLAESLIEKEKESMFKAFLEQLEKRKLNLKNYLEHFKISEEKIKQNFREQAEKLLRKTFIINEIARTEALFPLEHEVELSVNETLKKIRNSPQNQKDIDLENLRSYTFEYLTNQKVSLWLLEKNICV